MQDLPLFPSDYKRLVAKEAYIPLINRFAEFNPSLNESKVSLISRPGLRFFATAGTGHVRKIFTEAGAFNGDAFVVSGNNLYRVNATTGVVSDLGAISTSSVGDVSMAATSPIGTDVPSYLFIAEGQVLWLYTDNGHARGQLQASGAIANNDKIQIDGIYYQWTNASVDAGTPDGSLSNPWLVDLGGNNSEALTNLFIAIDSNGEPGTTYSTNLVENPNVESLSYGANDLFVQAKVPGASGNTISTTVITGVNLSWSATTLEDGGTDQLSQVTTPDDAGAISVAHINSFVIVVPVQSDDIGTVGRFYWVDPGERTIDPLNFATAERSPDRINQVITFSDMFWLFGDRTTEPWVTTGSPQSPMQRFQGIIFDRGSWEGTAVKIRDSMIVVDEEGAVFIINNGQRRISNSGIEERIRRSIQIQAKRSI